VVEDCYYGIQLKASCKLLTLSLQPIHEIVGVFRHGDHIMLLAGKDACQLRVVLKPATWYFTSGTLTFFSGSRSSAMILMFSSSRIYQSRNSNNFPLVISELKKWNFGLHHMYFVVFSWNS